jgi:hypothetical protein
MPKALVIEKDRTPSSSRAGKEGSEIAAVVSNGRHLRGVTRVESAIFGEILDEIRPITLGQFGAATVTLHRGLGFAARERSWLDRRVARTAFAVVNSGDPFVRQIGEQIRWPLGSVRDARAWRD